MVAEDASVCQTGIVRFILGTRWRNSPLAEPEQLWQNEWDSTSHGQLIPRNATSGGNFVDCRNLNSSVR